MRLLTMTTYGLLALCAAAAPTAVSNTDDVLHKRQLLSGVLTGALEGVGDAVAAGDPLGIQRALRGATATDKPASPTEAAARLQRIIQTDKPKNIYEYSARLAVNGLLSDTLDSLINGIGGQLTPKNSITNDNPDPPTSVFPKKLSCDAPYTVPEKSLRAAIYIPPTFTYGKKPPVILFPGTGNTGYQTFAGNFIKQLTGVEWADPVWINVPFSLLDDAQKNAQYAAYAINYIASISKRKVAVVSWSQGCPNNQWAFKYYPSTRNVTTDHLAISGDYKGTVLADFVCPDGIAPCAPSVLQQQYLDKSNFITALRKDGGDSAYVPTTSIYSALFDEIVQPQAGTGASAYLYDARGVGVENVEVQSACKGQAGGSFYTHESMLANPLAIALLKDAMAHDGPGRVARLNTATICSSYLGEGLGLGDFLVTENVVPIAGLNILVAPPRTFIEPSLLPFAAAVPPTCSV